MLQCNASTYGQQIFCSQFVLRHEAGIENQQSHEMAPFESIREAATACLAPQDWLHCSTKVGLYSGHKTVV